MAVRSGHVTNPNETLASAKAEVPADGLLLRESETPTPVRVGGLGLDFGGRERGPCRDRAGDADKQQYRDDLGIG